MQLRFDKKLLLGLPYMQMQNKGQAFKNHLLKHKNIASVSMSNWNAGERYTAYSQMSDLKTVQTKIVEGRPLSPAYSTDNQHMDSLSEKHSRKLSESEWMNVHSARSIIVIQKLAQQLHLKEPVIGQVLKMSVIQGTIVSVIQGLSLHEKTPLVVLTASSDIDAAYTYICIAPHNIN